MTSVFSSVMDIALFKPKTYKDLFLLGPFHWTSFAVLCRLSAHKIWYWWFTQRKWSILPYWALFSNKWGTLRLINYWYCHDQGHDLKSYVKGTLGPKNSFSSIGRPMKVIGCTMKVKEKFELRMRCPEEFEVLMNNIECANNTFLTFKDECISRLEVCQYLDVWQKIASIKKILWLQTKKGTRVCWLELLKIQLIIYDTDHGICTG